MFLHQKEPIGSQREPLEDNMDPKSNGSRVGHDDLGIYGDVSSEGICYEW